MSMAHDCGMTSIMTTMVDDCEIERFYDELQAHIVIAGGRKFTIDELENKPLDQIVKLVWPNGIRLVVERKR